MLLRVNTLKGHALAATDGEIGKLKDVYFDDHAWTVRYLIVQTGAWLGRHVLISPSVVGTRDADRAVLSVDLTREQVRGSPDVATHKPVSRQVEEEMARHYGWPVWYALPGAPIPVPPLPPQEADSGPADPRLRSCAEVTGYHIEAADGAIGHVADFVVDPQSWQIPFAVVDTRNWLPGREVLIPPSAIAEIDWSSSKVHLALTREDIENSPPLEEGGTIDRAFRRALARHYGARPDDA